MKLPEKIKILRSSRNPLARFRFGLWEGYDSTKIDEHLAYKINEIIDFLERLPETSNETPGKITSEDGKVIHEHDWLLTTRLNSMAFYECRDCGNQIVKPVTY